MNTEIPVPAIFSEDYPQYRELEEEFARIFADYTSRKGERNLVDYDDLLLFWAMLVETGGALADKIAGALRPYPGGRVSGHEPAAVAHPPRHVPHAPQHHGRRRRRAEHLFVPRRHASATSSISRRSSSGAAVVTLEENYRSTQPILEVTNTLISRAEERYTKNLFTRRDGGEKPWLVTAHDEQAQTRFVVDRILELHEEGVPLHEMAVLFRAGYMSADLEIELTARGIPFEKWGGIKFLEAAHVKDVLAFLRILENPRDEVSWYRLLMLMPGIGETTARSAIDSMVDGAWASDAFSASTSRRRARARRTRALVQLLAALRTSPADAEGAVTVEIARVRRLYDDILRERYDRVEPRLSDLDQLQTIAGGYPKPRRVPLRARARAAAGHAGLRLRRREQRRRRRSFSAPRTAPRGASGTRSS